MTRFAVGDRVVDCDCGPGVIVAPSFFSGEWQVDCDNGDAITTPLDDLTREGASTHHISADCLMVLDLSQNLMVPGISWQDYQVGKWLRVSAIARLREIVNEGDR